MSGLIARVYPTACHGHAGPRQAETAALPAEAFGLRVGGSQGGALAFAAAALAEDPEALLL